MKYPQISIIPQQNTTLSTEPRPYADTNWSNYFRIDEALAVVMAHIRTLPSAQNPDSKTESDYKRGLRVFMEWTQNTLPTEALIKGFIAHLINGRNLSPGTVSTKYLAPIRHYLDALASQHITAQGVDRDYISDCRLHIQNARKVKNPKANSTTNRSALWANGNRLTLAQFMSIWEEMPNETIMEKRDLALLYVGFTTALRVAEIARITPNSITSGDTSPYEITVRGKRNNTDPVPLDSVGYALIMSYVESYNEALTPDDPRYIGDDTPIWQALTRTGNHATPAMLKRYNPADGLTPDSLANIVKKHVGTITGITDFTPHDMRRTAAALAYKQGMDYEQIRALLRHKSIATTQKYVGRAPDLGKSMLSNYIDIQLSA